MTAPAKPAGERLVVALVRGLHGLRGAVRVEVLTDHPEERFAAGAVVHLESSVSVLTVAEAAPDRPGWLVRFREIPDLVKNHGVSSFKIFMFYGSHGLHGRSNDQSQFLMIKPDERYDYAHFEFVMRGVQKAREKHPELASQISLSLVFGRIGDIYGRHTLFGLGLIVSSLAALACGLSQNVAQLILERFGSLQTERYTMLRT